jgi:hypothetical protein
LRRERRSRCTSTSTHTFFYPIERGTLEVTRATLEAEKACYREGGDSHAAKNVGSRRYHEILVELKS